MHLSLRSRDLTRDIVLRILRGETLNALGRELTVSPAKFAQFEKKNDWRDDFLTGGQRGIQVRNPDQRDDFIRDPKTKRFQNQDWRSSNDASNCSRKKSAS